MVKEAAHVKGRNVGLDSQNDRIVRRKIEVGNCPQEEASDRPEPLGHGARVLEGALDAAREGLSQPQKPGRLVEGGGFHMF